MAASVAQFFLGDGAYALVKDKFSTQQLQPAV
jgi:sulfur relay (sulfurtransferase) DsrF/TusC family protein